MSWKTLKTLPITFLILGLLALAVGFQAASIEKVDEPSGEFWVKEGLLLEANATRLTWGLKLLPGKHWRFKIYFKANAAVWVKAVELPSFNALYSRFAKEVNETKVFKPPGEPVELTWLLENPNPKAVTIRFFVVKYEALIKPYELFGRICQGLGVAFLAASAAAAAWRKLKPRPKGGRGKP